MAIYGYLGAAVLLLAGLVYFATQAMQPKQTLNVTMNDLGGAPAKRRARLVKPDGSTASSSNSSKAQ